MPFSTFLRLRRDRIQKFKLYTKRLSPLHRQTLLRILASMILLILVDKIPGYSSEHGYQAKTLATLFDILPVIPTLAIIFLLGRYLARETDEFIRMLVVQALLWGMAATVLASTIQSALARLSVEWMLTPSEIAIMNVDLSIAVAMIFLCIQFRRNR